MLANQKKLYLREWIFPLLFLAFAVLLEMVNFLTLDLGVLPNYIMFDIAVWLIFLSILSLMKTGGVTWICFASFFLFLQVFLNIVNATLYNVFGDVFSFSMINLGPEGVSAFRFEFLDYLSIVLNVIILCAFIATTIYVRKTTVSEVALSKQSKFTIVLSAFIALQACGLSIFNVQSQNIKVSAESEVEETFSDEELWENMFLKCESLKKFGTYGFYLKNAGNFLFANYNMSQEDQEKVANAIRQGEDLYPENSIYSGIGEGDNLIVLMLESFDTYAIDPIFTPYLYKMMVGQYDGVQYLSSFYARNKTNISEQISLLGHVANEKLFGSYYSSVGLCAPYSLPNLILQDGATSVNYFHGFQKSFYSRDKVNVALGFQNVYGIEDCTLENKSKRFNDWIFDSAYIENMSDLFIPDGQRFFSYYTTISTHGPYDYYNSRIESNLEYLQEHWDEYVNYVEAETNFVIPTNSGTLKKYQQFKAMTMDTDKMVQYIFETLEAKGLLENTTVVMFADHNAYYNELYTIIKDISQDDYSNTEANRINAFIYNDELAGGINNTFCNTYDIYPTICDLLGLQYNTALVQGHSIYSDSIKDSVFVSSLSGMYTNNIFTTNLVDIVRVDDSVTDEQVENFINNLLVYYDKQKIIELIYKYNYFGRYAS